MNLVVLEFGYTRDFCVHLDGYEKRRRRRRRWWWWWTLKNHVDVVGAAAVAAFFVAVARRFREHRIRRASSHMLRAPRQVSPSESH